MEYTDVLNNVSECYKNVIKKSNVNINNIVNLNEHEMVTFAVLLEKDFDITLYPDDIENKSVADIATNIYNGLYNYERQ